jgi:rhomboid protease GluP
MRGGPARAPVTAVLVAANLLVFAAMLWQGAGLWHTPSDVPLAWGASFGPATKDGEWWRLASALFLHFGALHLAMNLWALWDCGRLTERLYGSLRFAAIYFASGLGGNLLSLALHGDRAVSGGASGAIFGLYGALLVCLWRERAGLHPVEFRWLFGGAGVFAALLIAAGIAVPGIDNAAHAGGLASGALLGAAFARPLTAASPRPGAVRWLGAAGFALAVAALASLLPPPAYRWHDERRAREEIRELLATERRIAERWREIAELGRRGAASFEELAERIESEIAHPYEETFEHLSALELPGAAPSAEPLEIARRYAQIRGEAAHMLAEGLRAKDEARIREALELARQAPYLARGAAPPR